RAAARQAGAGHPRLRRDRHHSPGQDAARARMSDILVSIVTPTLNQAAYLEETLRSVEAQTYPHLEHLVLDGASQDGSIAILERWQGRPRLRWTSEPDQGMYDAI